MRPGGTVTASRQRHPNVIIHDTMARIPEATNAQLQRAALVVCGNFDTCDARPILQALGLIPDHWTAEQRRNHDRFGVVHGTKSAVAEHRRKATALCAPCTRWIEVDERIRAFREGRYPQPEPTYERCGTNAGAQRHYRQGEHLCAACRAAKNRYQQARRASLAARHRAR